MPKKWKEKIIILGEIVYFHSPITAVCYMSEFKEIFYEKIQLPGMAVVGFFSSQVSLHLKKKNP